VKTVAEISEYLGLEFQGDGNVSVTRVGSLTNSDSNSISFLSSAKYLKQLKSTAAAVVILHAGHVEDAPDIPVIISENPYLSYARTVQFFNPRVKQAPGVHASAVIGEGVKLAADCHVGANAVIGNNVTIAKGVEVCASAYIGDNVSVGSDSVIEPNATVLDEVVIGERVLIHSGAVIGADGFGFANDSGAWEKIPQVGSVVIGNDVEIGACTSIDRGAIDDTVIGDGVKLDNQIQIGHNVKIGKHTAIAAGVGISGSAVIGAYCNIAGQVGVAGHLEIADGSIITGASMVTRSLKKGMYSSGIAVQETGEWRKNAVRLRRLNELFKRVKELENK